MAVHPSGAPTLRSSPFDCPHAPWSGNSETERYQSKPGTAPGARTQTSLSKRVVNKSQDPEYSGRKSLKLSVELRFAKGRRG